MQKFSVAVIGASGVVGGNMAAFLATKKHLFSKLALYDINPGGIHNGVAVTTDKSNVMGCDIGFVCVPTLEKADGSCDTSIVEEVCGWVDCSVFVIRSTVPPGTCESIEKATSKNIVFQPEYLGENPSGNAYNDIGRRGWVTLGGRPEATRKAAAFWTRVYTADCRIVQTDFRTAEMVKYLTNTFLAMKTVYCAEMAEVCEVLGVDYSSARELWLLDDRIGRSHTSVYEGNPGYSGKCLVKDLRGIVRAAEQAGVDPKLLKFIDSRNLELRAKQGASVGPDQLA